MMKQQPFSAAYIAQNRFGLGVHLKHKANVVNPQQWLLNQLEEHVAKPSRKQALAMGAHGLTFHSINQTIY